MLFTTVDPGGSTGQQSCSRYRYNNWLVFGCALSETYYKGAVFFVGFYARNLIAVDGNTAVGGLKLGMNVRTGWSELVGVLVLLAEALGNISWSQPRILIAGVV